LHGNIKAEFCSANVVLFLRALPVSFPDLNILEIVDCKRTYPVAAPKDVSSLQQLQIHDCAACHQVLSVQGSARGFCVAKRLHVPSTSIPQRM
jgi:hypothetical protein